MAVNGRQTVGNEETEVRDVQILNYQFTTLKDARPLDLSRLLLADLNCPANGLRPGLSNDNIFVLAAVEQVDDVHCLKF